MLFIPQYTTFTPTCVNSIVRGILSNGDHIRLGKVIKVDLRNRFKHRSKNKTKGRGHTGQALDINSNF